MSGISVDSAVDIAKESSDIILLENSLLVLEQGVVEGRRVFGNIIKYIQMAASSNFGNMFSVRGRERLPAVPADAADPGADQQPAVRLLADDDPDRHGGSGVAEPAAQVGRSATSAASSCSSGRSARSSTTLTFFVMLYVFDAWTQPGPVPHRLVRGVALHPDADHPRHPHQQDPVPAEPGELAADHRLAGHRRDRRVADRLAAGRHARLRPAAGAVLADPGGDAAGLRGADAAGEDLVYPQVWRMMAEPGSWCSIDNDDSRDLDQLTAA